MHGATGLEQLAIRADIDPTLPVPLKVRAREDAVLPIALLPDRDVGVIFFTLTSQPRNLPIP
jgi:hypothetical protein